MVAGCGKQSKGPKDRAEASGSVTYSGEPLKAGMIVFHSTERSDTTPVPIYGGKYSTDRVPLGKNTVTIDTSQIKYGAPASYVPIPEKYNDTSKSGLTADIKPGANENVDFKLEK
jgi:hypothetical protein